MAGIERRAVMTRLYLKQLDVDDRISVRHVRGETSNTYADDSHLLHTIDKAGRLVFGVLGIHDDESGVVSKVRQGNDMS